jgi:RNA polymerase sigma factor (sigma-70 family)
MGDQRTPAMSREQRFTELFTVCYGPILVFARRRLDSDSAQDIVAETFLTAWRRFDELSREPLPWLYGVASHAIANQRRGLARRRRLDDRANLLAREVATPDHADAVVEKGRLAAAFGALRERDQEVLRLVNWEGLSVADAAIVLGCSPSTFKVRLHRARRRLSGMLGTESEEGSQLVQPAAVPWEETL